MMQPSVRRLLPAAAVLAVAALAWWLFGFTTHREGPFTTRAYRRFGRVTRVDMSVADAPQFRTRFVYTWGEPYEQGDPVTSCAAIQPEIWQDLNGDGNWDTWLYRVGPDRSGECSVEYRVDLTNDGKPDWRFISAHGEHELARSRLLSCRGF